MMRRVAIEECVDEMLDLVELTDKADCLILIGLVRDQSALHRILAKINDLGLPLISVTRLTLVQ